MHVKIIEIIEVTDYVDDERTGETGVPSRIRERKRYYLRDGAPLELADPFAPLQPASGQSFSITAGDPNIYATGTAQKYPSN